MQWGLGGGGPPNPPLALLASPTHSLRSQKPLEQYLVCTILFIRGGDAFYCENKIRKTTMPKRRPKRKRRPPAKFAEKAPPKKRKRGPPAFAEKAKLPRYASHQAKLQSDKNEAREPKTMSTIRYGFRLAWAAAPLEMERAKVKPVRCVQTINQAKLDKSLRFIKWNI